MVNENNNRKEANNMSKQEMEARIREYRELKRMAEELDAEMETLADEIKQAMGEQEQLVCGEYKVRWTRVTSNRLDSKALKAAMPDVYAAYVKESHSRRFSIV